MEYLLMMGDWIVVGDRWIHIHHLHLQFRWTRSTKSWVRTGWSHYWSAGQQWLNANFTNGRWSRSGSSWTEAHSIDRSNLCLWSGCGCKTRLMDSHSKIMKSRIRRWCHCRNVWCRSWRLDAHSKIVIGRVRTWRFHRRVSGRTTCINLQIGFIFSQKLIHKNNLDCAFERIICITKINWVWLNWLLINPHTLSRISLYPF